MFFGGYGCSGPLLLILLFIGVVGYGGYGYGSGYARGGSCCTTSYRSYGKYGGKRGCYSYKGNCGGYTYGYRNNVSNRLILYIILLFLYGGCFGGFGGFCGRFF